MRAHSPKGIIIPKNIRRIFFLDPMGSSGLGDGVPGPNLQMYTMIGPTYLICIYILDIQDIYGYHPFDRFGVHMHECAYACMHMHACYVHNRFYYFNQSTRVHDIAMHV